MYGSHVLLRSLNPLAVARGDDIPDAITIDGVSLSRADILGAATSVAERIARADRLAIYLAAYKQLLTWQYLGHHIRTILVGMDLLKSQ